MLSNLGESIEQYSQHNKCSNVYSETCVLTGFNALDSFPVNGFERGELIVLGAQSGMGETDFAYSLLANMSHLYSYKCLLFSGTAPQSAFFERMVNIFEKRFGKSADNIKNYPIWVNDSAEICMNYLAEECRSFVSNRGKNIDFIIIDNLQLITDTLENGEYSRVECQSQVIRNLKGLAEELDCPIFVLSQLSRDIEYREDKRPWISDFEASDAIKEYADKVLLLYRDLNKYQYLTKIVFCKGEEKAHYDGIRMHYDYHHGFFTDPDYSKSKNDVYEIDGHFEWIDWYEASDYSNKGWSVRKVSEEEQLDISYLVEDKYISFFTDPNADCERIITGNLGPRIYPEIMEEFKQLVSKAYQATSGFGRIERKQPIWADMRDRYFDGRAYVYPDEMIQHIDKFGNKEIIAFLHYCTCYKERFCGGAYGGYAKDGFIGKVLLKLKDLPMKLDM